MVELKRLGIILFLVPLFEWHAYSTIEVGLSWYSTFRFFLVFFSQIFRWQDPVFLEKKSADRTSRTQTLLHLHNTCICQSQKTRMSCSVPHGTFASFVLFYYYFFSHFHDHFCVGHAVRVHDPCHSYHMQRHASSLMTVWVAAAARSYAATGCSFPAPGRPLADGGMYSAKVV